MGDCGHRGGCVSFFRGFPYLKRKSLIQDIPASTVRGAPLGVVELSGTVVGPYTLIAPLSQSDCFYYHATACGSSKEDKEPRQEILYAPFFLDDGTGRVLVDPRGAQIDLSPSVEEEYSPSTSDPLTRHFLVRKGISTEYPATLTEYCIRPGNHLFVLGTLRENQGVESAAASLAAAARPGEEGFLSAAAADLQCRAAIEAMYPPGAAPPTTPRARVQAEVFDLNPPVVLMKGPSHQPFLISWRSQSDVVGELAWRSSLYIWGGPILALAGLGLLLSHFLGR